MGAPEYYADGANVYVSAQTAHVQFYVERDWGGEVRRCEVAVLHLPLDGMHCSMFRAASALALKGGKN